MLHHIREPSAAFIDNYLDWTLTCWAEPLLPSTTPRLTPQTVMVLGLSGEAGEVAEVVEAWARTQVLPEKELLKELGDVIYYWARLCRELKWTPPPLLVTPCALAQIPVPVLAALNLVTATSHIAEAFKKYVRDGELNRQKFESGMAQVFTAWRSLCIASGLDWQEVIASNQAKGDGRVARGTVRGSGNDR